MLAGRYDPGHPPAGLPWPRRLALRHSTLPPTQANLRRLAPLLEQLHAIAARHDATPAAIALAWAINHDPVVVIPGASSIWLSGASISAASTSRTDKPRTNPAITRASGMLALMTPVPDSADAADTTGS